MIKNQPQAIKISYNGPFVNCQTAPMSFNQTIRNIALTQVPARHENSDSCEKSTSKTANTNDFADKMR